MTGPDVPEPERLLALTPWQRLQRDVARWAPWHGYVHRLTEAEIQAKVLR